MLLPFFHHLCLYLLSVSSVSTWVSYCFLSHCSGPVNSLGSSDGVKAAMPAPQPFIIFTFLLLFNASFQRTLPKEIGRVNVNPSVIVFLELRMDRIGTTLGYLWCTVPPTESDEDPVPSPAINEMMAYIKCVCFRS
jgi:hypothetical protein